ncbi:hypothetical protein GDO86_012066 [Hymenochirus boettgeri]|uniref:Fibrinogen C-terminal domain-containing protein n=1 Tax=Hymenochirus boettgeri TaxID=247094 RepID=A0A8T2JLP0_9PIPI|nr:hypothetical protein GDO86_012066 [Hymenochirus boettgeri]
MGAQGPQGISGINGTKGNKGESGTLGMKGQKGWTGVRTGLDHTSYYGRNCKELLNKGEVLSDWNLIYVNGTWPLPVLCDMHTDGGGWIVSKHVRDL